jgi:hypothetical protein
LKWIPPPPDLMFVAPFTQSQGLGYFQKNSVGIDSVLTVLFRFAAAGICEFLLLGG